MAGPVFRFAPSPNGLLHTGHAYSALLNAALAGVCGGTFLLRLEDIDSARCTRAFADAIVADLRWLGLAWPEPVRRQSEHVGLYRDAQAQLAARGLLYPCFCTRGDILRATAGRPAWPQDPDGSPLYPGTCRGLSWADSDRRRRNEPHAWRLDMARALTETGPLSWTEWSGPASEIIPADPAAWGDIVLARKDIGTSYHVAVVTDDALQDITHVVRGRDLYFATSVHRVLQTLLWLPVPVYRHHALVRDATGDKLSKSKDARPLHDLRAAGMTAAQVRDALGFDG